MSLTLNFFLANQEHSGLVWPRKSASALARGLQQPPERQNSGLHGGGDPRQRLQGLRFGIVLIRTFSMWSLVACSGRSVALEFQS